MVVTKYMSAMKHAREDFAKPEEDIDVGILRDSQQMPTAARPQGQVARTYTVRRELSLSTEGDSVCP